MIRFAFLALCAAVSVNCARPTSAPTTPGDSSEAGGYVTKGELEGVHQRLDTLERSMAALLEMKETLAEIRDSSRQTAELLRERNAPPTPRRPARPDPAVVYSVPVDGSPFVGPANAKITIVKAFEFACPFCDRVRPTLDEVQKQYGKDVRIVYKHFIVHQDTATLPAYAACAAARQGKFARMYELIFDKGFQAGRNLSRDNMLKLARSLKMKMKKFEQDMDSADCKERVTKDQAMLAKIGTRGTPAFFINGRFLSGAQPLDRFQALIDEELAKAKEAIAAGAKPVDYYDTIVTSGKREM